MIFQVNGHVVRFDYNGQNNAFLIMETSAEPKNKNARTCTYTPINTRYVVDLSIDLKSHLYFLPTTSHDESRGHFDHIASAFTFPLDFFLDG